MESIAPVFQGNIPNGQTSFVKKWRMISDGVYSGTERGCILAGCTPGRGVSPTGSGGTLIPPGGVPGVIWFGLAGLTDGLWGGLAGATCAGLAGVGGCWGAGGGAVSLAFLLSGGESITVILSSPRASTILSCVIRVTVYPLTTSPCRTIL